MEAGKVGTRDAVTVIGETETCRVRHEGTTEETKEVTEKLTVTETRIIKETRRETNEREGMTEKVTETETQELKKLKETTEMKTETRERDRGWIRRNYRRAHTGRAKRGQWGRAWGMCRDPVRVAG